MGDWTESESNIAGDVPDYPEDWPADQRVNAYWFALFHTNMPAKTSDWHTVWKIAQREGKRTANLRGDL